MGKYIKGREQKEAFRLRLLAAMKLFKTRKEQAKYLNCSLAIIARHKQEFGLTSPVIKERNKIKNTLPPNEARDRWAKINHEYWADEE